MKTIKKIKDLKGKRILLRLDFNVPMEKGKILDDTKIKEALPTINYLLENKTKLIMISHLGRPEGKSVKEFSLRPIKERLVKLLKKEIRLLDKIEKVEDEIVFLENIRFFKEELENNEQFAQKLSFLADIYVNDAFGVSHRKHASLSAITHYLPSYAGFLIEKEVHNLNKVLKPKKPLVILIGGKKIETKIGVIENLSRKADYILLGGALVNNFLKVQDYQIGDSLIHKEELVLAENLLKNKKLVFPLDYIVGNIENKKARVVKLEKFLCQKGEALLDIGPETIRKYSEIIKKAKTIIWNGPMGYFEIKKFSHGSVALARLIASRSKGDVFAAVGGGETIECLKKTKMAEYVDHLSTGGGAMLEFLAGKELPGLKNLI